MEKTVTIRDVDAAVWREFKARAVRTDVALGKALEFALVMWLQHQEEVESENSDDAGRSGSGGGAAEADR